MIGDGQNCSREISLLFGYFNQMFGTVVQLEIRKSVNQKKKKKLLNANLVNFTFSKVPVTWDQVVKV